MILYSVCEAKVIKVEHIFNLQELVHLLLVGLVGGVLLCADLLAEVGATLEQQNQQDAAHN